ncbi:MAG TPA: hypothetical protein VHB72_00130 [Candidatus Saccharimonadales bacterium]|nr:hypothetical protein [Candidatus Saccharimonadales bacterium]
MKNDTKRLGEECGEGSVENNGRYYENHAHYDPHVLTIAIAHTPAKPGISETGYSCAEEEGKEKTHSSIVT